MPRYCVALTVYSTSNGMVELNPLMADALRSPNELIIFKTLIPAIIALVVPSKLIAPALALIVLVNLLNVWQLISWWL